jgi:hypothetical protein
VASLLSVLERMRAPEGIAAGVNDFVRMLKVVMLAAVSAVVGLLFLLSIYREQQVQQKRRAFRYSGRDIGGSSTAAAAYMLLMQTDRQTDRQTCIHHHHHVTN